MDAVDERVALRFLGSDPGELYGLPDLELDLARNIIGEARDDEGRCAVLVDRGERGEIVDVLDVETDLFLHFALKRPLKDVVPIVLRVLLEREIVIGLELPARHGPHAGKALLPGRALGYE